MKITTQLSRRYTIRIEMARFHVNTISTHYVGFCFSHTFTPYKPIKVYIAVGKLIMLDVYGHRIGKTSIAHGEIRDFIPTCYVVSLCFGQQMDAKERERTNKVGMIGVSEKKK